MDWKYSRPLSRTCLVPSIKVVQPHLLAVCLRLMREFALDFGPPFDSIFLPCQQQRRLSRGPFMASDVCNSQGLNTRLEHYQLGCHICGGCSPNLHYHFLRDTNSYLNGSCTDFLYVWLIVSINIANS